MVMADAQSSERLALIAVLPIMAIPMAWPGQCLVAELRQRLEPKVISDKRAGHVLDSRIDSQTC